MLDGWCIYPAYLIIIKELAEEFKGQFTCLGENTERYITFSIPIKNEVTRINKKEEKVTKTISYRLQFIDSARFMIRNFQVSLIILLKEFMKLKVNMDMIVKNVKHAELNTKIVNTALNMQTLKMI